MARGETGPFARGETYANGNAFILDTNNPENVGGVLGGWNLTGKEYDFEPNAMDAETGYPTEAGDPSGRPTKCKVVRNTSGVNLKPGRLVHYDTSLSATYGYEVAVDGYCYQLSDRPAGIVDDLLPPAGVAPNDLFYIIIEGPTYGTQPASPVNAVVESRLVPSATGSSRTDDTAGRLALQDTTATGAALFEQIQNAVGLASLANDTANAQYPIIVRLPGVS
jgi:hypothetical protein